MTTPLLIRVTNTENGTSIDAGFKRSPVRVGRNQLNDLAIDEGFVSQWHGLVRFDDEGTKFLDLGSTNGTKLAGDRLEKNVEVELAEETELEIGPLKLRFVRMALTDDQVLSRRASAFQLGGTRRPSRGVAEGGTVELKSASQGGVEAFANTLAQSMSGAGKMPPMAEIRAMAQRQQETLQRLRETYAAFEKAKAEMDAGIKEALDAASNDAERDISRSLLRETYPLAFEGSALREEVGMAGNVGDWVERLSPGTKFESDEDALQRTGAVLEAFASAYLDLRAGQKQIRNELGIEPGSEAQSLPHFADSRELIGYLLDPSIAARFRLDELARAFADFAVHQLGLVAGATEGTRALLTVMSPQGIGAEARGAIVRTTMGFGDVLWPFRAAGNYYRYVSKHLEVSTSEKFKTYLFGSAFGRAYYRITGAQR